MATLEWHEVLRVRAEGYFDVAGVNLFDSEGMLINSSETWPVPDIKISDRPATVELRRARKRRQTTL
jgi:hypothetical protein